MNYLKILTLILLIGFQACKSDKSVIPTAQIESDPLEMVTIDVIQSVKNPSDLKINTLVEWVEYIKLETRPECLVTNPWVVVGEKLIIVSDNTSKKILVFNRSGQFIRSIGRVGKGPGEYQSNASIDLSPDEDRIIVRELHSPKLHEYNVDGTFIKTYTLPSPCESGPFYLNEKTIVYLRGRWIEDDPHFARVIAINTESDQTEVLYRINHQVNSKPGAGYFLPNEFSRTDEGIFLKDELCDTVYLISSDRKLQPIMAFEYGMNKANDYVMTEAEIDAVDMVGSAFFTRNYALIIGNYKERFHLVYNRKNHQTFTLSPLQNCRGTSDYPYGIMNDLDGTYPYWPYSSFYSRNNSQSNTLQIIDLLEIIKTDCFQEAKLTTPEYRDQLINLVKQSSADDNPIIRILHFR